MGAVQITQPHAAWVADTLREYAELLRIEIPPDLEAKDFESARRLLHERTQIPFPETLDHDECRLEWATCKAEGEIRPHGRIGRFVPHGGEILRPPIGATVKVRLLSGSLKALVVGIDGSEVLLMRAPNRRERRLHPRTEVAGIALISLPSREETAKLKDMSEGGLSVTLPIPIEVGNSVHLLLRIHGKKSLPIECDGIVTSCRSVGREQNGEHRVGVKFVDISPSLLEKIRDQLRKR